MYRFLLSCYYFLGVFLKKRSYDVIFYYPQYFNRGKNGENYFFKHYYHACIKEKITFVTFEEPYAGSLRNRDTIPFDFAFYLIVFLRKVFQNKDQITKDRRIGRFLSYTLFKNIEFKNFIVLSQSMISVFAGMQPQSRIFDNQHGIIYPSKTSYFNGSKVAKQLVFNNVHILVFGRRFREILIKKDTSCFMDANSHIIGFESSLGNIKHTNCNNCILVTLQFTHDHSFDENLLLLKELYDFISSVSSCFTFYLKHHPRYNNEIDISKILKLSNVRLAPNDLSECFNLCSLHATAYSSSTFEASLLGIPTILIPSQIKINFFKTDFVYPLDYVIDDFLDKDIYHSASIMVKRWAREYYSKYNSSTFIKLLK